MSGSPPAHRRALLSVSEKKGLVPFAEALRELSFELISTGGTARLLREAGLQVTDVSEITGFPEIMDGRVKTLHPAVHGGLLARAGVDDAVAAANDIEMIDLLVVNLYPFESVTADPDCSYEQAVENIDVGGPAMLRAAAKNHGRVSVVVDVADYEHVLDAFRQDGPTPEYRRALAAKAFAHTAAYDALISDYFRARSPALPKFPERLVLGYHRRGGMLRYGENPHQEAALYADPVYADASIVRADQLQGKALSFNNLVDADAALQCVKACGGAACVIVKHASPCGIAIDGSPEAAYEKAFACDKTSAFGGVIAFNRAIDERTAERILDNQFAEVIVAPAVDELALDVFADKPNIRVLACGPRLASGPGWEIKSLEGGALLQDRDIETDDDVVFDVVSDRPPSESELQDLRFAWMVVRFVKSNAIVYARSEQTLGIGAGQPSRVMSARIAALKAEEAGLPLAGAAMASDAYFPFRDGIDAAAERGIRTVVQPGGSIRDEEVIGAANQHDIAMVFTGRRHFRH